MKFTKDANINGTSWKGEVRTTYYDLVKVFGEPDEGPNDLDADKVTCCWRLEFEDGTIASIYDWKTNATPMGSYLWHIGGRTPTAVDRVLEALDPIRPELYPYIKNAFANNNA